MGIEAEIKQIGLRAQQASAGARRASTAQKNRGLEEIAQHILNASDDLMAANALDLDAARASGLDAASLDRLILTEKGIQAMSEGLQQICALEDPVGKISQMAARPNGLEIGKMRTPIGVIGIIYESRPNVTIDAAGLCIKSGNVVILRGGSECIQTNLALFACIGDGLKAAKLDPDWVQLIETTDRAAVGALLALDEHIDMIIPRGGKSLIERVSKETRIPILKHLDGNCHLFVNHDADLAMAEALILNSKTQRYAVCNALETLLIHKALPESFVNDVIARLVSEGVEVRACQRTLDQATQDPLVVAATGADWSAEYLGPVLAVKTVDDLDEAIHHINAFGSNHTDTIVTQSLTATQKFMREVDSSSVMVNASTRFADGFEYGLGAEIGISTDKLHARGPVGLEGLTSEKYVVYGQGQIRG
ncbi:MAG: glutamate-5-semialdehyde dehydrogenase [Pseudomonadales bacterium]|nr:glutamate-5-semialdehyde dehydrogenase [Pseudomonadales bacterium]